MKTTALSLLIAVTALGCIGTSGEDPSGGFGGSGGGGGSVIQPGSGGSGAGGSGDVLSGTGAGAGSSGGQGCSDAAKLIYVLSEENDLYSFQPDMKQFKKIGPLGCQTSMQPNSMAIDRDAVAWVNYVQYDTNSDKVVDGAIFKVSTADASCQPTSIKLGAGLHRVGMGFSTDKADGTSESLFVTGDDSNGGQSAGLARVDFGSMTVKPIGGFTGTLAGQDAELTGTGDARLFGFFMTTPVELAEINKGSGAILSSQKLTQVETPFDFAFSFWGGDFYLYTSPDPDQFPNRTTNVTRYHYATDKSVDTAYMMNIGFHIVGAGVSTCAPTEPPK